MVLNNSNMYAKYYSFLPLLSFLYPMKTLENQRFCDVFKEECGGMERDVA